MTYRFIVGLASDADHGFAGLTLPNSAHTFPCVAAPALALRIFGKDASANFGDVILMNPGLASPHDVGTVIEQEAILV